MAQVETYHNWFYKEVIQNGRDSSHHFDCVSDVLIVVMNTNDVNHCKQGYKLMIETGYSKN